MRLAPTLSLYVARRFLIAVGAVLLGLLAMIALFDFIELLRRAATRPDATFGVVAQIAALRLPWIAMEVLPFGILLGGIAAFWRLARHSELIVARAAGVSPWQLLVAPVGGAVLLGVIATTGLSPVSAVMFARAEQLDNQVLRTGGGPLALSGNRLWLRQSDRQLDRNGTAIVHARDVALRGGLLTLGQVTVFRLGANDRFLSRIEATSANLLPGRWRLEGARVVSANAAPAAPAIIELPTDLTVARVQESFASPDTLSFWALPDFIDLLEQAGFSALRHRLHFHALLALPLLAGAMALLAAGFSMRHSRRGGVGQMLGLGVLSGFALFVLTRISNEFGQSGALPVPLAAWTPAAAGLLLATTLLLYLEDG